MKVNDAVSDNLDSMNVVLLLSCRGAACDAASEPASVACAVASSPVATSSFPSAKRGELAIGFIEGVRQAECPTAGL